jgi:hypothetical protein
MRASRVSNERGIALAVAVFALVVIGAVVAVTFFAGRLEQQTGQNTMYASQASEAAEAALIDALGAQDASTLTALPNDPTQTTSLGAYTGPTGSYVTASRTIRRLGDNLFLFQAVGSRTNGSGSTVATRSLSQLIRLNSVPLTMNAGLTALGDVKLSGGAEVTGIDAVPPLWSGFGVSCPPTADVAGVRYNLGSVTGANQAKGAPATVLDATLSQAQMKSAFDQLKPFATVILSTSNPAATQPAYTGNPAKCNKAVETNWGEPTVKTDPCFNYFPIIYYKGDLKLQGDRGQGILLVEGDLTITGSMIFYGPVYVTGTLSATGNSKQGAKFYGGVVAGNVALDDITKLAGGAMVDYSSCALKRALTATATPAAFNERGWVQTY